MTLHDEKFPAAYPKFNRVIWKLLYQPHTRDLIHGPQPAPTAFLHAPHECGLGLALVEGAQVRVSCARETGEARVRSEFEEVGGDHIAERKRVIEV